MFPAGRLRRFVLVLVAMAPGVPRTFAVDEATTQRHADQPHVAGESLDLVQYAKLVEDLDDATSGEIADLFDSAANLVQRFRPQLQRFKQANRVGDHNIQLADCFGRCVVDDATLFDLVHVLGEISVRVTSAEHWGDYAIRGERLRLLAAKNEIARCNLAELQRAYADFQMAVAARQHAAWELWGLTSGRARLVVTETYSGSGTSRRAGTVEETFVYASNSLAASLSPIRIRPPVKAELKEVFSFERLTQLRAQEPHLRGLAALIDGQLKNLAAAHGARVQAAWQGSDETRRIAAIASLGWWNEGAGRQLLESAMAHESAQVRRASCAALGRWRHDEGSLGKLARHPSADARQEAVRQAREQIHQPVTALRVVRLLLEDQEAAVRGEAYTAASQLTECAGWDLSTQFRWVESVLKSRKSEVVLDAIAWVSSQGDDTQETVFRAKQRLLLPLTNRHDGGIREAASTALAVWPEPREAQVH